MELWHAILFMFMVGLSLACWEFVFRPSPARENPALDLVAYHIPLFYYRWILIWDHLSLAVAAMMGGLSYIYPLMSWSSHRR